jgi:hypothetical protein
MLSVLKLNSQQHLYRNNQFPMKIQLHQLSVTLLESPLSSKAEIGHYADFFKYNNYKNHIINNKSNKSKILNGNAPLLVAWSKCVTASDVFTETCHCQ